MAVIQNRKFSISTKLLLKGHKDMVTCLSVSPDNKWLASGSEDRTVRIWNLNTKRSEKICLIEPSFFSEDFSITWIEFCSPTLLLVSVGSNLLLYSLETEIVVIKSCTKSVKLDIYGEINMISVFEDIVYLACDEAVVRAKLVLDSNLNELLTELESQKPHKAFVTCLTIQNKNNFSSGGLDCLFYSPQYSYDLSQQPIQHETSQQLFNPPYVNWLSTDSTKSWVVAGLGNGSIEFFKPQHKLKLEINSAHTSSIVTVEFPQFTSDSLIISGSVDGEIAMRRINLPKETEKLAENISKRDELLLKVQSNKKPSKAQQVLFKSLNDKVKLARLSWDFEWRIVHPNKINCFKSSSILTPTGNLFVCDVSYDITCYTINET